MPSLFAPGPRPLSTTAVASATQAGGRAQAQSASASGKLPAQLPVVDPVSADSDSVTLSAQALAARAAGDGGKSTLEATRQFMATFARALFGDAAKGAAVDFNSASVDASATAGVSGTVGQSGAAATLTLDQSAHFSGSGQIVTEDGRRFDFEVDVNYRASASVEASASQNVPAPAADVTALTGKPLPAIKYPGSLVDLFKVLGRQLAANQGDAGTLNLRLTRLVDQAALLAPRLQGEEGQAKVVTRQMAANAYASAGQLDR